MRPDLIVGLHVLVVSPLSRLDRAEPLERIGENVIAAETRVLGRDLEVELKALVCPQVIAGPRNQSSLREIAELSNGAA